MPSTYTLILTEENTNNFMITTAGALLKFFHYFNHPLLQSKGMSL